MKEIDPAAFKMGAESEPEVLNLGEIGMTENFKKVEVVVKVLSKTDPIFIVKHTQQLQIGQFRSDQKYLKCGK